MEQGSVTDRAFVSGGNRANATPKQTRAIEVLSPPANFAIVEPGLYRSTMPSVANFPFLKQLALRHVIILSADSLARNVQTFFEDNGIKVWHIGAPSGLRKNTWKATWKPMEDEVVKTSLEVLLRKDSHPLLLCDTSGVRNVGVVVGCLRRLQYWNLNSIISEYRGFAGLKTRYVHEQMIELFDTDLIVVPEENPPWYCAQVEMLRDDEYRYSDYARCGRLSASGKTMLCSAAPLGPVEEGLDASGVSSGEAPKHPWPSLVCGKSKSVQALVDHDPGAHAGIDLEDGTQMTATVPQRESVLMNAGKDGEDLSERAPIADGGRGDSLAYRVYYYSSEGPLNSLTGGLEPRLRRLNM